MRTANIGLSKITVQVKLPPNAVWRGCHLARGVYSGQGEVGGRGGIGRAPLLLSSHSTHTGSIITFSNYTVAQFNSSFQTFPKKRSMVPDPENIRLSGPFPVLEVRTPKAGGPVCFQGLATPRSGYPLGTSEAGETESLPSSHYFPIFCVQSVNSLLLTQSRARGGVVMLAKCTHGHAT